MPKTNQPWTITLYCLQCDYSLMVMSETKRPEGDYICDNKECEMYCESILKFDYAWRNTLKPVKNLRRVRMPKCCATCRYLEYDGDETDYCIRPDGVFHGILLEHYSQTKYYRVCDRWVKKP